MDNINYDYEIEKKYHPENFEDDELDNNENYEDNT